MKPLNLIDHVLAMGRRYQQAGRHREAVTVLTRLSHFRYLPADAAEEAQIRLAELHLKRRKYKHARRHLTAALRHQPDNARYHYLLATTFRAEEHGDLKRAGEHYRRALELDPGHVKCLADYGLLLLRVGQTEEALLRLREAVERAPEDVEVIGKLVKGLRLAGRSDEARSALQISLFRNARSPRFGKLWNEFRFQQAWLRRGAERRQCGDGTDESDQPIVLPFVRVLDNSETSSDCPTNVRHDQASDVSSPHAPLRMCCSDQRHVQ
jgi:tetratricopeptide (TPR) repeat protein